MARGLLSGLGAIKRKVFVSHHHSKDKAYYDAFINTFSNSYDVIHNGTAKLTFRHDRNAAFSGFKLPLPFFRAQKHLVLKPDNPWQIPDDGQD